MRKVALHNLSLFRLSIVLFSIILFVVNCTTQIAGGGSEGGNARVMGKVVAFNGNGVGGVLVKLYPKEYNPLTDKTLSASLTTMTSSNGSFIIPRPDSGVYNVYAVDSTGKQKAVVVLEVKNDSVTAPDAVLHATGAIKVYLTPDMDAVNGYVYIPGTDIVTLFNQEASVTSVILNGVPEGVTSSINYSTITSIAPRTVYSIVTVSAYDTTSILNPLGKHSERLILNTTKTGADVSSTVLNFPILIRLTKDNFNFSEARNNGSDIRFSGANTTLLSYEIEQWDSLLQQAQIWVNVDAIYGNDSSQYITMHWGAQNATITSLSNSQAVFDTANGYSVVLHLSNNGQDATANAHNGSLYGVDDTLGIIGTAKKFDGTDSIKIAGLLGTPKSLTLSAWARLDSTSQWGGEVVSIGNAALIRMDENWSTGETMGAIRDGDTTFYNTSSGNKLSKTGWHLLTYTVDQSRGIQTLYIDGVMSKQEQNSALIYYTASARSALTGVGKDTYIGKHGTGLTDIYNFTGIIDEVRISKTAFSADYIKLSFMNQQVKDALVIFGASAP